MNRKAAVAVSPELLRRSFVKSALLVVVLLSCASVVYAAITGVISGIVSDNSGAVLPGTAVVAVEQSTGVSSKTTADSKGFYSFPALPVGTYTVHVKKQGFKDFAEQDIHIDANSSRRVDIQLEVGEVTQTEQVYADQLQIETQSTQLGQVIDGAKITSVPLNGRSFTDLLALQPGVSPYAGTSESGYSVSGDLNSGNESVNGGREASNGFMINGADANEGVYNGAAIIPNLDSIAEFRIITNNFDPEYGNFSGGQINVVTKSGTNAFHGDAFDFLRNTDLDARNYFATQRSPYIQNQFGGVLGGPIRKDKLFFFGDFQGTKQIQGATQFYPVPSTGDRSGDLTDLESALEASDPANGGLGVQGTAWASTLSQRLGYTVSPGEPYYTAGCTSSSQCVFPNGQVPTTAWDTPAAALMKYIPQANSQGTYFSTSAYSERLSDYKGGIRVDYATRYGNLFGYYFLDNFSLNNPYYGVNTPGFNALNSGRAQMVNLGLTSTFKANSVNDFRFAYLRDVNHLGVPVGGVGPSLGSLGFVSPWGAAGGIGSIASSYQGVPNVDFNNFQIGVPADTLGRYNNTFQWMDSYSRIVGAHTLRFGGEYHYDQINERNYYAANGQFTFNGQETGSDWADFLVGAPSNMIQASFQILNSRSNYIGAYAADSWRATTTLTLNYGVRYEISTPWYDTNNMLETIIPGEQSVVFPGAPKGYLVPGDPGVPRTLAPTRYDNFAPRFGFAFAPSATEGWLSKLTGGPNKSSIRGGFGMFYTNIQDATGFVEVGDAPFGLFYVSPAPPEFSTPYIDRATGNNEGQRFPFTYPPTNVSAKHPDTTFNWAGVEPISGAAVLNVRDVLPYVESFYLSVQREFPARTVLTVDYVGNVGRKLLAFEESNPGNAALCLQLSNPAALAPGQSPCGPGLETSVYTLADGSTVEGTRQTLGIDFGSNPYMNTVGASSYNSLQASLQHRDKYAEFLLAYTFSRSFDNASSQSDLVNVLNPRLSWGLSAFDVTNNVVTSYTVPLPFDGYVERPGLLHNMIGGWSVSGITTLASGLPITMSEQDDRSLTGTGADLPSYDPSAGPLYVNKNPRSGEPYFNPNAFSLENLGTFGNSRRRFFHGPGINNTDLALLKSFDFTEATKLQFRAEAFNVANHTQFGCSGAGCGANTPSGNINNQGVGGFGYITSARDPRILQVALKFLF